MGNSFCKLDNGYMVKDKRMFVSCITDLPGIGKQTSDSTWEGKCMYHDEAKLKALIANAQATKTNPSKQEEAAMYKDTGLTCKVTSSENGPIAVTNPGSFPAGFQKATLKSSVSPDDASAFEIRYMEELGDAYMRNTTDEMDKKIQGMYDFHTAPASAPALSPSASVATPASASAPVIAPASASAPVTATPVVSESAWSPVRIALLVLMILFGVGLVIFLMIWIFKDNSSTPQAVGGKRRSRK